MKRYLMFLGVLFCSIVGFSQNSQNQEGKSDKVNITTSVQKTEKIVMIQSYTKNKLSKSEGENLLENNGYIKKTINGKDVYVKENKRMKIIYKPNN